MPVVKRVKEPEFYRDKMLGNLSAVGETNYRKGIEEPKHNPILAGIAAEARFKDEMGKVISEERRKKMLEFSSMDYWGEMAAKFAGRLVTGVRERVKKLDRFWTGWTPILSGHVSEMDKKPIATFGERKAKMIANVDGLKAKKGAWLKRISSPSS